MQAGIANLLSLGAAPVPVAQAGDKTAAVANDSSNAVSEFEQLLSDGEPKAGGSDLSSGKDNGSATKDSATNGAANALVAQEINAVGDQLKLISQQIITPEDASKLLGKFDELSAQLGDKDAKHPDREMLDALKDQLQAIVDSGEPATVSEVLAASDTKSIEVEKVAPLMQRVMQMLHATLKPTTQEAPTQVDAKTDGTDVMPDVIAQSLQASMFRADAESDSADTQTAEQKSASEEETDTTITEIIPLSAQLIALPQWANDLQAANKASKVTTEIAAPTALNGIQAATLGARANIDEVIPPLTLQKETAQALPAVTLPRLAEASAANVKTVDKATVEKLDALINSVTPSNAASNPVLNPSLVGGNSPTQTTQAAQPAHTVALPHVVNHAPVTDQVHVAIKRAAQDGLQQITIQLDPVDLGRVEVKMQMGVDGQTQISFIADKASTFDSLSRDARMLEQSLHEAGIKADTGSMQFNLRQQPQPQLQSDSGQGQGQKDQQASNDASETDGNAVGGVGSLAAAASRYYNVNIHDGVDIRA